MIVYPEETPELAAARRIMNEHHSQVARLQKEAEARIHDEWMDGCIGRTFKIEIEAPSNYGDPSVFVSFTACLVTATRNGGKMTWDNGVTTEGDRLHPRDAVDDDMTP